ncbi:MAG TPA: RiPP maturation radical SAM C-methyltransferase [Longimicrobium sp.]
MGKKVLLVNMPFGGADRPAIGISTLKAGLTARGIPCDIRYLNFVFAELVGPQLYQWFSDRGSHMIFAGEWMFASEFFGEELPPEQHFFQHLRDDRKVDDHTLETVRQMRRVVRPFLDHCLESVNWPQYDMVGFTSTFEQNLASLALAHAIKCRHPQIAIVMGGANCEGSMGEALHRHFPYLDYVFTGAADHTFPQFVERVFQGEDFRDIPGIAFRENGESRTTGPTRGVEDLDTVPFPDYDDYFAQMAGTRIPHELAVRLQIETSRGCWWGMKHHCTFCGMNAAHMRFRSKSKDRVLDELTHLVGRYRIRGIDAVDAIMDMEYFRGTLQELRDRRLDLSLFYELKANLRKPQVQLLAEAGVTLVQPGIESFHSRILKLMSKGANGLQNIQLLKWCRQFGVEPTWNLLYGFPGERAEDYEEQLETLRSLTHLSPPRGSGRLRMDRFSPHFERWRDFGFTNVRPLQAYRYIYPFSSDVTFEIAYFFDYDYADGLNPSSYIGPTEAQLVLWREAALRGASLTLALAGDGVMLITDRRGVVERRFALQGWQKEVYAFCEQARPARAVQRLVEQQAGEHAPPADEVAGFLAEMVRKRLMVQDGDWFLSLAVGLPLDAEPDLLPERQAAVPLPVLAAPADAVPA